MSTFTTIKVFKRLREEQEKEQRAREEERATKIGRSARVRLFRQLPLLLGIIPRVKFNPHAWRKGKIISENLRADGMEYTLRFQNGSLLCLGYYSANAVEILSETK